MKQVTPEDIVSLKVDPVHTAAVIRYHGGAFAYHLSEAMLRADMPNLERLLTAYAHYAADLINTHGLPFKTHVEYDWIGTDK